MKTKTAKNGRVVAEITVNRPAAYCERGYYDETATVFRFGRRIVITSESISEALILVSGKKPEWLDDEDEVADYVNENAYVQGGQKTLTKLFERALAERGISVEAGRASNLRSVFARYGENAWSTPEQRAWASDTEHARLRLKRIGQRVYFKAPCGAEGYLTVREVEKLVALLPTL